MRNRRERKGAKILVNLLINKFPSTILVSFHKFEIPLK